jgi:hypothetical protein
VGLNLSHELPEGPMKLYFLYLLIASIATLAHFGARAKTDTETDKTAA